MVDMANYRLTRGCRIVKKKANTIPTYHTTCLGTGLYLIVTDIAIVGMDSVCKAMRKDER